MQNELTDTVTVGGFPTIRATRDELAALMVRDCLATRAAPGALPKLVFSSNGQGISLAGTDGTFADAMLRAGAEAANAGSARAGVFHGLGQ